MKFGEAFLPSETIFKSVRRERRKIVWRGGSPDAHSWHDSTRVRKQWARHQKRDLTSMDSSLHDSLLKRLDSEELTTRIRETVVRRGRILHPVSLVT
jgi:hypothetical protein